MSKRRPFILITETSDSSGYTQQLDTADLHRAFAAACDPRTSRITVRRRPRKV